MSYTETGAAKHREGLFTAPLCVPILYPINDLPSHQDTLFII